MVPWENIDKRRKEWFYHESCGKGEFWLIFLLKFKRIRTIESFWNILDGWRVLLIILMQSSHFNESFCLSPKHVDSSKEQYRQSKKCAKHHQAQCSFRGKSQYQVWENISWRVIWWNHLPISCSECFMEMLISGFQKVSCNWKLTENPMSIILIKRYYDAFNRILSICLGINL